MFDNLFNKYITPKNIIFGIISILFLVFITKIKDIAILFFAAYVISCSLNPLTDKLAKKLKRGTAAGIVVVLSVLVILAFFVPIIAMAGHEIKSFVEHIPTYAENLKHFASSIPFLNKTELANIDITNFLSTAGGVTTQFLNQSINISINFASSIIYFIVALIIIYYFMADKDKVRAAYLSLFPTEMKEKAKDIVSTISQKIGGYVLAQIATMTSVGIIMTLGLLLSGIEYALLLGLMTAILDIIPVVGPAIALVICLITTFKSGALAMTLVCVVFAVAQLAENNFVRPYIFGKILDIHPLIIYFFLLVTAQYLGVIGVIFAPAIAATVCVLIEELYIKNIN